MSNPLPEVRAAVAFEAQARRYLSDFWGVELQPRTIVLKGSVKKSFDLVSADGRIVGDAKWYKRLDKPAARFKAISEYVWLLQQVDAERRFLVFGQDAEVAERWLGRFRSLAAPVEFYFLDGEGPRRL